MTREPGSLLTPSTSLAFFGFCAQEYSALAFALRGALVTVALIAISLCCTCAEGTQRLTHAVAGATFNFIPGLNSGD